MSDILISESTTGARVAEADLGSTDVSVQQLLDKARKANATVVWAHGGDLTEHGFRRVNGYTRLHAERAEALGVADPTARPIDLSHCPTLATDAFLDQWGHKRVNAGDEVDRDSIVVGLEEGGGFVGICRLWVAARLVDGPGLLPSARSPQRKARLLQAACTLLGPGSAEVDTWGEDDETLAAYVRLGLTVEVREAGWELVLPKNED